MDKTGEVEMEKKNEKAGNAEKWGKVVLTWGLALSAVAAGIQAWIGLF